MGPVVLNVSRVLSDIMTFFFVYMASTIAFTVGMVLVLNSAELELTSLRASDGNSTSGVSNSTSDSTKTSKMDGVTFLHTMLTLFWSTLGPGQSDSVKPNGLDGIVASVLFAVYQILVAIIMLNLLIAIMNSTVQKVQDHQQVKS